MTQPRRLLAAFALAAIPFFVCAGQPPRSPDLRPNLVKFSKDKLTLKVALAELQQQSGNAIVDRRSNKDNPELTLQTTPGTFWQALDQFGIGFSAYQEGGGVALVDTPYRKVRVDQRGIFRFAVKRVAVSRDDETQAHICQVTLDAVWEPRFKLLYLNLQDGEARFGERTEKLERQAARPVSGTSACEIDLTMKAPGRAVADIALLKGNLRVIGAPKMLDFAFVKLNPVAAMQEGVKVGLTHVDKKPTRWTVEVLSEYPAGAIGALESYQSWMDNNRVWLSWTDPKTNKIQELEPSGEAPQESKEGTKIRYEFTPRVGTSLPLANALVTLRYRTPNRVVAFMVPFEFQGLPLP